ncbi:adhesion G protein-coupled receptor E2-like [Dendronephthya gigantea]|uniref:adhesion G protein-coupled receptor E2-like n=1 Tax=Dendronephthya gigantea TaxID=151771 RepID=UPI0010690915|nr:adhesion G protein-coupled receptor E2-like [Dendronephthya gigantea]
MLGCHNHCKDENKCVGFNYRTTKNVENCQLTNVTKEREKVKAGDWVLMLDIEATKNEKRNRENFNGSADTCLPGYAMVGKNCTDIDECLHVSAKVCHSKASCNNTNGSYNCTCLTGYSGNGKNCTDIDECANVSAKVCHTDASCNNTNGSYNCTCFFGYSGDGKNCTDVDDCSLGTHKCHSNATCKNTIGSYECHCRRGFAGNGTTCSGKINYFTLY